MGLEERAIERCDEASEMYVWLPISNIYEIPANGRAGRLKYGLGCERGGICIFNISRTDAEDGEERAGGGSMMGRGPLHGGMPLPNSSHFFTQARK